MGRMQLGKFFLTPLLTRGRTNWKEEQQTKTEINKKTVNNTEPRANGKMTEIHCFAYQEPYYSIIWKHSVA